MESFPFFFTENWDTFLFYVGFNFLCHMIISSVISIIETIEEFNVPRSKPPLISGFVKKSPNVAPNGLVKIKAIQKSMT